MTSGTTSFSQTALQIITDSYQLLRVYGQGDVVSTNNVTFAMNLLNKMVKGWEGQGIHLWTGVEGALFQTVGQQVYNLVNTSSDMSGDNPVFNFLQANASGTFILVTSITGLTIGDNIGITLDNNTLYWTTISSFTGNTQVNLVGNIPSAASQGNNVFSFTNRVNYPLDITNARFMTNGQYERPIGFKGRDAFMSIPNKTISGKANQFYYTPQISQGLFYVWPVADSVQDCIRFSYTRKIQDFDLTSDTPDLPQEWLECITYNLAVRLAPACGKVLSKDDPDLLKLAAQSLQEMTLWDADASSTMIVPNYRFDN
jgi:hypothetical protein